MSDNSPPPVYRDLVNSMAFDPVAPPPSPHWDPWKLDENYPPTAGELAGTLMLQAQPVLWQEETHDGQETGAADAG